MSFQRQNKGTNERRQNEGTKLREQRKRENRQKWGKSDMKVTELKNKAVSGCAAVQGCFLDEPLLDGDWTTLVEPKCDEKTMAVHAQRTFGRCHSYFLSAFCLYFLLIPRTFLQNRQKRLAYRDQPSTSALSGPLSKLVHKRH